MSKTDTLSNKEDCLSAISEKQGKTGLTAIPIAITVLKDVAMVSVCRARRQIRAVQLAGLLVHGGHDLG